MTELSHGSPKRTIAAPRRRAGGGGSERSYVRFAVLGNGARRRALAPWGSRWPQLVAEIIATQHDISSCDASTARATAYDIRRVQLRTVLAHRPQLVALDVGPAWLEGRDLDTSEVRSHLTHCARTLSARGAVLVTARSGRHLHRGARQLNVILDDLAAEFDTIHLDRSGGTIGLVDQFSHAASARGLGLSRSRAAF